MNRSRIVLHFVGAIATLFLLSCKPKPAVEISTLNLFPSPTSISSQEGEFSLNKNTVLVVENTAFENSAQQAVKELTKATGFSFPTGKATENAISVTKNSNLATDAYNLQVTSENIRIESNSPGGVYYAFQTLKQLLPDEIVAKSMVQHNWAIPAVTISDAPRFSWRGMHMDLSRHFFTQDEVEQFIDYMASYKLNRLHLHLTDDQGWRIEIKKYPELTEKGAWRLHNGQDSTCIKRSEHDATYKIPEDRYKTIDGVKKYGGFYTQEQMKEIIAYAKDRNIEIIPEIDVPGHFMAAIANYPYLSCSGKAGWGKTFSHPACLGKETTYDFIQNVLGEVADLFPNQYLHIGGDEVNKTDWETCPHCQKEIKKHKLKNEHELQTHFNGRIEEFLTSKGKKLLGWDEIVEGGVSENSTVMWWRNWAPKMRYDAVNKGSDLIITPDFEYYFDFSYEATPVAKVYNYEPVPEDFTAEQEKHVIGVQANLWSERIPSFDRLTHQAFPRMIALAETAWCPKGKKDFDAFETRLRRHYNRLDLQDIYYHIPNIKTRKLTVFTESAMAEIEVPFNQLEVHYTVDGSVPTQNSPRYETSFEVKENMKLRARAWYNGKTGVMIEGNFEKQDFCEPTNLPNNTQAGIRCSVAKGHFQKVEEVRTNASKKSKVVKTITLDNTKDSNNYGLVHDGFVKIDADGIYEFTTSSDDGDLLYINNKLVVDNGGSHATNKRSGMIALRKGYHSITSVYRQFGGGKGLNVYMKDPNGKKIELNETNLVCK